jgi:hypothetical protein
MKVYQLFYIPLEMDLKHFHIFICKRIKYYRGSPLNYRGSTVPR